MSGQRTINTPTKRNFIREASTGRTATKSTEVVASPSSSYRSDNAYYAGSENDALVGLLKSLSQVTPELADIVNEQRLEGDRAAGAKAAAAGGPIDIGATPAYKAAYMKIKAVGAASDTQYAAMDLMNRCKTMTPEEYTKEKQKIFTMPLAGQDDPDYLTTVIPLLKQHESQLDHHYAQKQIEYREENIRDSISKSFNPILAQEMPDKDREPEKFQAAVTKRNEQLKQVLHFQLDQAAALGKTTLEMNDICADLLGAEAYSRGDSSIMGVFKETYKNGSAYNSTLKPKIDGYIKKAEDESWSIKAHKDAVFRENEANYNNDYFNRIDVALDDAKSSPKAMAAIKAQLKRDMLGKSKDGFALHNGTARVYLNEIQRIQKGEGRSDEDLELYTNLRQKILYDGTIKNYADLMPYRGSFKKETWNNLLGFIDQTTKTADKMDAKKVERASILATHRTVFDTFVKSKSNLWQRFKGKPGKVLADYDTLMSTLPTNQIGTATAEMIQSLKDSDVNKIKEAVNDTMEALEKNLKAVPVKAQEAPKGIVKIKTDAEYNALPSGTDFIGPDNIKRRKP
jgi:hypothetical protein